MSTPTEPEPPSPPRPSLPGGMAPRSFGIALAGILVALLLLGSGGFLWMHGENNGPAVGGPFALVNGDGKTVTDRDFRGKYMLVYFGYTYCPDVCPTTLNEVANALDKLGPKADQVQPIFITVDPKRDNPEVMKKYVASFGPRLIGLTGTPNEVASVAKEYRVYYAEHRTGPGPNDYTMDHSSILYLMGPNGRFVAPVRADESGKQMAADLDKLIS
jgi:protein SCO1